MNSRHLCVCVWSLGGPMNELAANVTMFDRD